jgi:hypothetical protein
MPVQNISMKLGGPAPRPIGSDQLSHGLICNYTHNLVPLTPGLLIDLHQLLVQ